MNAKRPEPPPPSLTQVPTEIEIAEQIDLAKAAGLHSIALLIRRLAFQLDCHTNKITYIERPTSPPPPKKRF